MIYDIAGITVDIDPVYDMCVSRCRKYAADENKSAEFCISRNSDTYSEWLKCCGYPDDEVSEYLFFGEWFYHIAVEKNAFLIHSSAVAYEGHAVLFSAPPGTGKSTHTAYWKKAFGDRVVMINDDKPLVSVRDDGIFVSGTPFSGKNDISENITVPLKAVVFLHRSKENVIERINASDGFRFIWLQTIRNMDKYKSEKMLTNIKKCAESADLFVLGCTNTPESALIAREAIFQDN